MTDVQTSILSSLQTISLSTLGSTYPERDLPKDFVCKKPCLRGAGLHPETAKIILFLESETARKDSNVSAVGTISSSQ